MTLSPAKLMLLGLYTCPVNKNNPIECQLFTLRNKFGYPEDSSYASWYEWVRGLSDKEAEDIYLQHKECLQCKEDIRKRISSLTHRIDKLDKII
jgi:hypothetical protein